MTSINKSSINEILHKKEYKLLQQGREERDIEIATNLINEGLPAKLISKITGLDINTIKQLKLGK